MRLASFLLSAAMLLTASPGLGQAGEAVTAILSPSCSPLPAAPLSERLWDWLALHAALTQGTAEAPGCIPANASEHMRQLFTAPSAVRAHTYEILFPQQRVLAQAVFALALREVARRDWGALTPSEKAKVLQQLRAYADDDELLLEEWAVRREEVRHTQP